MTTTLQKAMTTPRSDGKAGATSVAPVLSEQLAAADRWEPEAFEAIQRVDSLEAAEELLRKVTTVEQALRVSKMAGERERRWRELRLRAERRYGELLGKSEEQPHTGRGHSVCGANANLATNERFARTQARKVANVPEKKFEEYVSTATKPSRAGLLAHAQPEPKRKKRKGDAPTVTGGHTSVADRADVLNWVRSKFRAGHGRDQIVSMSQTDNTWPVPGHPLSNGSLGTCRAAIRHLEQQGVRWPLGADGPEPQGKTGSTENGRRLHQIGQARAALRRAGEQSNIWDMAFQVTKLTGLLISWQHEHLEEQARTEDDLDQVGDVLTDMLMLREWTDSMVASIESRMGEQRLRDKVAKLRSKTVANGCTAEEAAMAQTVANRLERDLTGRVLLQA